jgi:probable F420-dependent oxidoreductase
VTHQVRIGVQIQPQHASFATMRAAALDAEERGVDVVFNWDHFYPLSGEPDGQHFECLTQLAAFAEATSRVEIGPLVLSNSYRNPNLLADMARTIDHISGGRFILGIGAGWFERDYTEYGYEFGEAPDRARALKQNLSIIEQRLAVLNPPPMRKIPLLVAGKGEQVMLRLVARHADIWHTFGDADTMRRKGAVLERWCAEEGRDPSAIEWSNGVGADRKDDIAYGEELLDAGVTFFTFGVGGPDYDLSHIDAWVKWRDQRNGA